MFQLRRERKHKIATDSGRNVGSTLVGSGTVAEPGITTSMAHAIVDTVREPLIVLDRKLHLIAANRSFCRLFHVEPEAICGSPFHALSRSQWDIPALLRLLDEVIVDGTAIEAYESEIDVPGTGRHRLLLNARRLLGGKGPDAALIIELEDVTARREADRQKDELLRQQEILLLEVQHRIANSLQIIASILLLKARTVESEIARSHLHDTHDRVISVATLHEQLRMSPLGNDVVVAPYLSKLCESLVSSMVSDRQHITVTVTALPDATVRAADAVSYGLIVTELIINAFKHGFPDGREGCIAVDFFGDRSGWRLSVSDNGVGRHLDPATPERVGLGTSIVEALAHKLEAKVEISAGHPGTTTSIVHVA